MEKTKEHELRSLVELVFEAYKANPQFFERFAWEMWADTAERTLTENKDNRAA
jgi:hypothetical protein